MTARKPTRPQVLLTLPDRPWPADGGKRLRSSTTLQALAAMDVDLDVVVLFAGRPREEPLPPGVAVRSFRQVDAPPRPVLAALAAAIARRVPWQMAVPRWGRVRQELSGARGHRYDLVWFGATDHAVSLRGVVRARRTAVDMDDVEVFKLRAFLALPPDRTRRGRITRLQRRIELPLWKRVQGRVTREVDAVLVCSELDRERLGGRPGIRVVPNGYPEPTTSVIRPTQGPPTLLFIGTYSYPPNVDAAVFAATEVLPRIRAEIPDARLHLVGRDGDRQLVDVRGLPGVDVIGAVPDAAEEVARAHVSLVPIRYGGGTRVKILEAFALGSPVVATPLACEGLDADTGVHLLTADDADGLARACIRLLRDDAMAGRLADAARGLYRARYRQQDVADMIRRQATALLERP